VVAVDPHLWLDRVVRFPLLDRVLLPSGEQYVRHVLSVLRLHGCDLAGYLPGHRNDRLLLVAVLQLSDLRLN
jgi:hypothetical protein